VWPCRDSPGSAPLSNPTPLIIGASYGDAATQKLRDALNGTEIEVLAHTGVTTALPIIAAMPGHHGHALGGTDKYSSLFGHGGKPVAIADVPVGEYVHDLLSAYPNSCVFLALMPVLPVEYLHLLMHEWCQHERLLLFPG
jgi:hypothetical protein